MEFLVMYFKDFTLNIKKNLMKRRISNLKWDNLLFDETEPFAQTNLVIKLTGKTLIAKIDAESTGESSVDFSFIDPQPSWYVQVYDCYVNERWRGYGIGTIIFNKMLSELKMKLPNNTLVYGMMESEESCLFWQRFGFDFEEMNTKYEHQILNQNKEIYMFQRLDKLSLFQPTDDHS